MPTRLISLLALAFPTALLAQLGAPISYAVTFPNRAAHYAHVRAQYPTDGQPTVELMMADWSPGYYKVENYADNVDSVLAATPDGRPMAVRHTTRNRWVVETGGAPSVVVRYRVKAERKFVTADWVGDSLIVLCGAPTFITMVNGESRPAIVDLTLPAGWTSATSLDTAADDVADHYLANDYDELVDSPIVAGNLQWVQFDVAGRTHLLVDAGAVDGFDAEQAGRALLRVVGETYRFWGFLPYKRYVFLNVFRPGGGGLEHKGSTLLTVQAKGTQTPEGFDRWLAFVAHEYFHAYNVKRLRPVELGPFDYEGAPKTTSLWIAEGLTTYYADLMVARAGLVRQQDWLDMMSALIAKLQNTPGRRVQTLSQSSLDAWNSESSGVDMDAAKTVSYYTKGPVVGLLLDAHLRAMSGDSVNLDDVMRAAYAKYAGATGYTAAQFQQVADSVAHTDLTDWFHRALDTTQELDYQEMLDWFGLKFQGWGNKTERWNLQVVDKPTPEQTLHLRDILLPDAQLNAPTVPVVRPDTAR
ncbi:MAG: M61 family metallopeptidase [Gemmatimonadota bacterium]|nr:M61 family metallopeptidase [Gemmatimonadota bacterium]